MYVEAFLAGLWASVGSILGKVSGKYSFVTDSYLVSAVVLVAMVLANSWGCRLYLRSLDAATNSVAPTVVSVASNYVVSGIVGIWLFNERSSIRWWLGATFIITGLALITRLGKKDKKKPE